MKPTKNLNTLKRRYSQLGVTVTKTVATTEGHLVADGFRCRKCGTQFFPDARQLRNRHRCPNGCKLTRRKPGALPERSRSDDRRATKGTMGRSEQ